MARESDVHSVFGERHDIGLSAAVSLAAIANQCAITFKLLAGGTLEIGGAPGVSQTWGSMYPLGANEVMNMANAGSFYLWASGATCTIAILRGKTDGA